MDTITGVALIIGAALAWMGMTVFVLLRLRRRRKGSTVVATAPPPADSGSLHYRPWRRDRPPTTRIPPRRQHRLRLKKVRG